jgi:two-component system, LytTR family, sensor kinase
MSKFKFEWTRSNTIVVHVLFWLGYIYLNHFIIRVQEGYTGGNTLFTTTFGRLSLAVLLFYIVAYGVLPYCYSKPRRRYALIPLLLLLIPVNFLIRYFGLGYLLNYIVGDDVSTGTLQMYFLLSLKWYFDYTLFGFGFWYAKRLLKTQKELQQKERENLELKNRELENEKKMLLIELGRYRSQINQHFLYNTLSFLYTRALKADPELASGLERMSDIMQYGMDNTSPNETVLLDKELKYLNEYVALHRMRTYNTLQLNLSTAGDFSQMQIPPHVLITLVENALKHGIKKDPENPIEVKITGEDKKLIFRTRNKINPSSKIASKNIGLTNIKDRLGFIFGNAYSLTTSVENDEFILLLEIDYTQPTRLLLNE